MRSVQAVLEELKSELVGAQFNAFELLDRNANAETLHGTRFGPDTVLSM